MKKRILSPIPPPNHTYTIRIKKEDFK